MNRWVALTHPSWGQGTLSLFTVKAHDLIQVLLKNIKRWKNKKDKEKLCVKVLIYIADLPTVGYGTMLNSVAHCQCVETIFEDWSVVMYQQ